MNNAALLRLAVAGLTIGFSGGALAVGYSTYHNDAYTNYWAGFNQAGEFGLGDDVVFDVTLHADATNQLPGEPLNPTGSSSSYHLSGGDPAFYGLSANGTIIGFADGITTLESNQVQLGANSIADIQITSDQNVFDPYGNGNDIDEPGNLTTPVVLNQALPNYVLVDNRPATLTVNADQTIANDYYIEWEGGAGGFYARYQSGGWVLGKGQNPADIFSDPIISDFFANLIPFVEQTNPNWTVIGSEFGVLTSFDSATDNPIGTFNSSQIFFSEDIGAALVPVPAALVLMLSGLGVLGAVRVSRPA